MNSNFKPFVLTLGVKHLALKFGAELVVRSHFADDVVFRTCCGFCRALLLFESFFCVFHVEVQGPILV